MRLRARLSWIAISGLSAVACQLMVGDGALVDVRCAQEGWPGPPACDDGQVCAGGRCVSADSESDAGLDGHSSGGAGGSRFDGAAAYGGDGSIPDAGSDVLPDGPLVDVLGDGSQHVPEAGEFGAPCDTDDDCHGRRCLERPNKGRRCSMLCCDSTECPTSTAICVPYLGANACFEAADLGRSTGKSRVGATCESAGECRSGRCSSGRCIDTCCGSSPGCSCQLLNFEGTSSWYCGTGTGTGANFAQCTDATSCASSNCMHIVRLLIFAEDTCAGPCCSDADCGSGYCEYVRTGSRFVRQCVPNDLSAPPSSSRPCCDNGNCATGRCSVTQDDAWVTPYLSRESAEAFRCL
ncbi:MAG: hypothetical protein MUF54_09010 [Polyangiaceae bacterium]|jgi:hypothetical protein|nr:hypothetical protein [Polyangiaceae bacterium]